MVGPASQTRRTRLTGDPPASATWPRLALGLGLGGPLGGERLAEALAGAGQEGPRRDVADAEGGGQLEPGQVVELGEQEGGALALRDPGQGALHVARQARVHDEVLGRRRRPARFAASTGRSG